jgi:ferric-dicitrate binding protein FerR (iron transport regulator)
MAASADIVQLIYKYIRNDLSVAEEARLNNWLQESVTNRRFFDEVTATGYLFAEAMAREQEDKQLNVDDAWRRLSTVGLPTTETHIEPSQPARLIRLRIVKYVVAASVTLLVISGAYLLLRPRAKQDITVTNTTTQTHSHDVAPNTKAPTLTLADGTVVLLDSTQQGTLAIQGNTNVIKNASGQIVYTPAANAGGQMLYNTMTVPKGGNVVSLALADGSKVWLNAASSIRYPAAFSGAERKVEITGEAYFEVARNASMPFRVSRGNVDVEVLGTHFNVNAFPEEKEIKVTLLEGRVKVNRQKEVAMLKPGEQAVVESHSPLTTNHSPDIEQVMAWKNGLFMFNNTDIENIMQQIERWYDVTVYYEGDIKRWTFNGQISRYSNVSKVLEMMEATGTIHFRVEDRKIYVMP